MHGKLKNIELKRKTMNTWAIEKKKILDKEVIIENFSWAKEESQYD